ncbi:PREDICTED: complement C1q-like protein 4 [Cyprinodon variegatus]|uniref:complement C1q-like protein 4 n=1 Tax=Cyprinodon variegatus TaxID=28743 RepID=UPI000742C27E|nr:PREDICTED: complement C1q-like protein 4 [Cyprinodon variegatus]
MSPVLAPGKHLTMVSNATFLTMELPITRVGFSVALAQDGLSEEGTETKACFPDMCELIEEFGAMKAKQEAMETSLKETENQVLELKNKEASKVAFSAAAGGRGTIGPYTTDTTMIYNTVITNVGNAYNQQTGIFVAPFAGMYYFTFFYHAGGQDSSGLVLVKNNQYIISTTDHSSSDSADNGGNAAFLQLQQGDQVSIRLYANCHVWGSNYRTSFSGVLLYSL